MALGPTNDDDAVVADLSVDDAVGSDESEISEKEWSNSDLFS